MGYNITLENANFRIRECKLDQAWEVVAALNKRDDLKSGGSWSGGEKKECWFSWMDADYPTKALEAFERKECSHPLEYVFSQLGFDTTRDEGKGLRLHWYDSKTGDEEIFLDAVAPFVEPGSFLEWSGEDGLRWRHEFNGEVMIYKAGRVVYD